MKSPFYFLIPLIFVINANAGTPNLQNLNLNQADTVLENFGAALLFRSVEPPSSYASIFGLTFGFVGAVTSADKINTALNLSSKIPAIPVVDIFTGVQLPLGLAIETGFLPKAKVGSFSARRFGANIKWTFTDLALRRKIKVPFHAALRVGFTSTSLSYGQVIAGVQDTVKFESKSFQTQLAFSRQFGIVEPYMGLGYVRQDTSLSNTATASVDLYNFTTALSYGVQKGSFWFNTGAELKLLFMTLAAEYHNTYAVSSGVAKLGFKF